MPESRNSIENEDQYDALRDKGYAKETAARIANSDDAAENGGSSPPYEDWTRDALYERAAELNLDGRSDMTKSELIAALRDAR